MAQGAESTAYGRDEARRVSALDDEYQAAVQRNDAATMARILADGFVLVGGNGKRFSKEDLLEEARSGRYEYDLQRDSKKTVRLWGDTAVVNALLIAKGKEEGKPFAYRVWFSDTYARINGDWKYVFGQSGERLSGP